MFYPLTMCALQIVFMIMIMYTYIEILADCSLLRYRGSRGGHATRARLQAARLSPKLQQNNCSVVIPGPEVIPTVIGRRLTTTVRQRSFAKNCTARPIVVVEELPGGYSHYIRSTPGSR